MPPSEPGAEARTRVLVIDDDVPIAKVIARTLRARHEVRCFEHAEEALALLTAGERFGLILCDLMMPGMSGMEFHAAALRLDPEQAGRIVFLSGGACTEAAERFLASVPNARVRKPFDLETLERLGAAIR